MRSRAAALNAWAWTVSGLVSSPLARILTGMPRRLPRPLAWSASSVTSAPESKRLSRSERLTGCVCVRNGSKGIDFFMWGPRRLRIRLWIGIWPPSRFGRDFAPVREPAPFWPRPDVLPVPEPSPRPTRLRALREPRGGLSEWRPISSGIGAHQVADGVDHAPQLGRVVALDGVADPAQAERAQRPELALVGPVGRLDLGDRDAHELAASSAAGSSVASASASGASGAPWPFASPRPSTALIDRPRSSATSSGVRRPCRPATVALTRLIGFCEPRLLERMSWMPASSSTARTPPPAMTPVPGDAGLRNTRPDPNTPVVWCVIVWPCLGTRKRFFLARSTPFWMATGTSLALP